MPGAPQARAGVNRRANGILPLFAANYPAGVTSAADRNRWMNESESQPPQGAETSAAPPPGGKGRRSALAIVCSDHGTAYGEDGYSGHRLAHPVVWTVPYAEFLLEGRS